MSRSSLIIRPSSSLYCRRIVCLLCTRGDNGWRKDGVVVRALAPDAICGLSLLLVLSFATGGFSPGTPIFPLLKNQHFQNSNSTRNQVDEEPLCRCATFKSLFIYLDNIGEVISLRVRCHVGSRHQLNYNISV